MAYITLAELEKQFQRTTLLLLSDDELTGAVVTSVIDAAISTAQELIDAYLGLRYEIPLYTVPPIVTKIAGDVVMYELYARRPDLDTPQGVTDRFKNALKLLENIAHGKVMLNATELITESGSGGILSNKTENDALFKGRLGGY